MDILSIGILVFVGVGLVVYSVWPRKHANRETLQHRIEGRRTVDEVAEIKDRARTSATQSLVKKAAPMLSRIVLPASNEGQSQLRAKLTQAGYRAPQAQTVFLASKTGALVLGAIVGAALGTSLG